MSRKPPHTHSLRSRDTTARSGSLQTTKCIGPIWILHRMLYLIAIWMRLWLSYPVKCGFTELNGSERSAKLWYKRMLLAILKRGGVGLIWPALVFLFQLKCRQHRITLCVSKHFRGPLHLFVILFSWYWKCNCSLQISFFFFFFFCSLLVLIWS